MNNSQPYKIELRSNVDVGTENIVQNNTLLSKKNAQVFKGLLSNTTYSSDDGLLSTSGKKIYVADDKIHLGDIEENLNAEYYAENDSIKVDNIISAEYSSAGLSYISRNNLTSVSLNGVKCDDKINAFVSSTGLTLEWVSGLCENGLIILSISLTDGTYHYLYISTDEGDTWYKPYDTTSIDSTAEQVFAIYGYGKDMSLGIATNYYYVGFDDTDMRKRFVFPLDKTSLQPPVYSEHNNEVGYIHGMGCVASKDDSVLITGEPMPLGPQSSGTYGVAYPDTPTNITTEIYSCSFLNSSWSMTELPNGVLQFQVQDLTQNQVWNNSGTITTSASSRVAYNATIPVQSEIYKSSVSNPSNYVMPNLLVCEKNNSYGVDSQYFAIYLEIDKNNGKTYPKQFQCTGQWVHDTNNSLIGTRVYYIEDSDVFGSFTSGADGTQVFPHMRLFANRAYLKGQSYDYGRGWVKAIVGSFINCRYTSQGETIMVENSKMYTKMLGQNLKSFNLDFTVKSDSFATSTATNYIVFSDESKAKEDWPADYIDGNDNVLWTPSVYITAGLYNDLVRVFPITDGLKKGELTVSHSLSSNNSPILNKLPCYIPTFLDNVKIINYEGINIGLVVNKTLIWTAYSMEHKYNILYEDGDIYLTQWDGEELRYCKLSTTGIVKLYKIADYMFGMNILGRYNLIIEDKNGSFTLERLGVPFIINIDINNSSEMGQYFYAPPNTSVASNDIIYYGAGFNVNLLESEYTSFLIPPVTLPIYIDVNQTSLFTNYFISQQQSLFTVDTSCFYDDEDCDLYFTHSRYSTDIQYKSTILKGDQHYKQNLEGNSYWITSGVHLFPIGISSSIEGVNYVTSTIATGENLFSRLYNNNNKVYASYNNDQQIYYGNNIFTIMSGNYYYDGQGIYYLGSQNDYSQNIFTAYALGMKFLANSSAEAYFYSEYDKALYLYTASNTLQFALSLADCGNILDSVYSSQEQTFYILFDDGKLWCKTPQEIYVIENVEGDKLFTTEKGCFIFDSTSEKYTIYNPQSYDDYLPLLFETEWIGDVDRLSKFAYADIVFYNNEGTKATISLSALNGDKVEEYNETVSFGKSDWKNQLCRKRVNPTRDNLTGTSFKIKVESNEKVSIHSITIQVAPSSESPMPSRGGFNK